MTKPANAASLRRKRKFFCVPLGGQWEIALICFAGVLGCLRLHAATCSPAVSGIVGWWPGDGTAVDIISTNNGILQGGATATGTGLVGNSFIFDGTNASVQIPDSSVFHPSNFTVEAWVQFSALNSLNLGGAPVGDQYIVFKQNSLNGNFEGIDLAKTRIVTNNVTNDVFRFQVASSAGVEVEIDSSTPIITNVWYHVAGVRGSNFTQIYVNGNLERQTNVNFPQNYGNLPLYFGTSGQTFWDSRLRGTLDEVSLYSRALSSNEIAAIYAAGASGKCKAVAITAFPPNQTVIVGTNVTLTVTASGLTPLSYQWQFNGNSIVGATNSSLPLTNVQTNNSGNYTVVVTNKLSAATSAVATLTVLVPPSIATQPQSSTNILGTTAIFSSSASGSLPLIYQWWSNGIALANIGRLNGATSNVLTISNVQSSDAAGYLLVVSNPASSITSAVATLTVLVPPSITGQPAALTVNQGQDAAFSVTASGTLPLTYQWRFNGSNIPGATASSYTRLAAQPGDAGSYVVVVTNVAGSVTSTVATLTVNIPPAVSAQPQSLTVTQGQDAPFSVAATGTLPLAYQWRFNFVNIIPGATASSYTRTNAQSADAGVYAVVITNVAGSITSAVANLIVNVPPAITAQPQSLVVNQGQDAPFSAVASGTLPLSYQWRFNGTNIAGANASNYTRTTAQPTDGGSYTVVVTNLAGGVTSSVATLTVNGPPTITGQPSSLIVTQGQDATFAVISSGTQPLSYQWRFNGGNISSATSSTYTRANAQSSDAGGYFVVITNVAGSVTSTTATLTVYVPPSISAQPQSLVVTQNQSATFSVSAGGTLPLSYQWRLNSTNIPGATGSSFARASAQPADAGPYTVVVTNVGGAITSTVASLTVLVPPSITSGPASLNVTQGLSASFSVTANGTLPLGYQWSFGGANIAGAMGSTLTIPNAQLTNSGSYRVVVTNVAGAVTSSIATLSVLAPPVLATQPSSTTNVTGSTVVFSSSAVGSPTLGYRWRFNGTNLAGTSASRSTLTLSNVQTNRAGNYSVVVTNSVGSQTSSIATLTVLVPPTITAQPQSQTSLIGSNALFSVTATGVAPLSYQWKFNGVSRPGATGPSLALSNVQPSDSGGYAVVIANGAGLATSTVATLTVTVPPTVLTQPQPATNAAGTTAIFNVGASGYSPLGYQWIFNGTNLGGATGIELILKNVQTSNAGGYSVVVTNIAGSVTSSIAALSVTAQASQSSPIFIPDLNLSNALYSAVGRPPNPLAYSDMLVLTNFFASYRSIINLSGLELASNLAVLHLSGNAIRELAPLQNLVNLRQLDLDNNSITTVSRIAGMASITSLNLGNNCLTDAGLLASSPTLTNLFLNGSCINDISFTTNLPGLQTLDVGRNPIGDYSPIASLTNLQSLFIQNGSLADLTPFANLKQLTSLVLFSNAVTDVSTIGSLNNLSYLDVRGNPVTNHNVLGALTNLTRLCFGWTFSVTNVDFVQSLPKLTWLDFGYSQVTGLAALSNLTNLNYLVLSGNPITNYTPLSNLKALADLELRGGSITNATFLTNLTGLQYADLYNSVTNLAPLGQLTNLNSLALGGIQSFNGLTNPNLTNLWLIQSSVTNAALVTNLWRLRFVDLGDNALTDPVPLKVLTNLVGLGLSGNTNLNVTALAAFTNLTVLSIDRASVTNLSAFVSNLPQLSFLSARQNRIADLSSVSTLSNLVSLYLDQNLTANVQPLAGLQRLSSAELTRNLLDTNSNSLAMAQVQSLSARGVRVNYLPQNQSPSISIASNWLAAANAGALINFFISDDLTSSDRLALAANSSNQVLIPNANILVSGTNQNRTLTFSPNPNQTGTTVITVTITDDAGLSTNASVLVTVVAPQPVTIPDPNLQAAIRASLSKPSGNLNNVDMAALSGLSAPNSQITNLTGLEWATNLDTVILAGNPISDLIPLQGLAKLNYLTLDYTGIGTLSSLSGLTGLNNLSFLGNRVTDLSALLNLPQLISVNATLNLLDLSYGSAPMTEIFNLQARDVFVQFDPQRTPPVILASPAWVIPGNSTSYLSFIVSNNATPGNQFLVSATSSNPILIPNANILPGFYGNLQWVIAVTPTLNQTGAATISLTAIDDAGLIANASVSATVFSSLPVDGGLFDNTNLSWTIGGNSPWFGETFITHSGVSAAQSGAIGDGQESWIETTVPGPGPLTYWWKVSSETNYDFLQFYINGILQTNSISGEVDWQQQTTILPTGSQTLRWRYTKDKDTNIGADAAWLDDVSFISVSWLQLVGVPTNGQSYLLIYGALNKTFEVQSSIDLLNWSSLGVVTITNTPMPFMDPTASPGTKYYRLREVQAGSVWLDTPKSGTNTFQWVLHSPPGLSFEVQASTNLTNWTSLGYVTNTLGSVTYTDHLITNFSTRYYRARQLL